VFTSCHPIIEWISFIQSLTQTFMHKLNSVYGYGSIPPCIYLNKDYLYQVKQER